MKIFIDARWTKTTRHDGVSRYGASLAAALAKLHPVTVIIYDKAQLKLLPKDIPYVILNHPFSPKELFIARTLNSLGADIVFSPLQYMGWMGRKYKLIFTLHDLIYYHYPTPPRFLPWYVRLVWRLFHLSYWPQRWVLNHADYVATVSKTSRKYMQEHRITKRQIGVVYNAPDPTFIADHVSQTITKDLVFMGSFMPYKNVECLVKSLKYLPDYTLHLLSPITPKRRAELEQLIPKNAQVKFWGGISDKDYSQLLSRATALVSASKEEGFGLPLVEGMAQGVPVICSDIPIFHEVAGEAGLFFNPESPADFAAQVRTIEDKNLRDRLSKEGQQQARHFNWDDSATVLFNAMKKL